EGRERVLEVRHEDVRARIERVDHHLPLDRPGDLDVALLQIGGRLGYLPRARSHRDRLGEEVERRAGRELAIPLVAPRQQLSTPCVESTVKLLDELERFFGEHLLRPRTRQLEHAVKLTSYKVGGLPIGPIPCVYNH